MFIDLNRGVFAAGHHLTVTVCRCMEEAHQGGTTFTKTAKEKKGIKMLMYDCTTTAKTGQESGKGVPPSKQMNSDQNKCYDGGRPSSAKPIRRTITDRTGLVIAYTGSKDRDPLFGSQPVGILYGNMRSVRSKKTPQYKQHRRKKWRIDPLAVSCLRVECAAGLDRHMTVKSGRGWGEMKKRSSISINKKRTGCPLALV